MGPKLTAQIVACLSSAETGRLAAAMGAELTAGDDE